MGTNKESAKVLDDEISRKSKVIEDVVYEIVKEYTAPLDDIMNTCRTIFNSQEKVTNIELEDLLTQLPSALYFVNEGQELVGIKEDISKMIKTENYNQARANAKGTVADKNTEAEMAVMLEELNRVIYQRAYKMIRSKVEMGQEMIASLKRVFDARMKDYELSGGIRG